MRKQRRHPQFPTISEVTEKPYLAYSDHLLTTYTAQLPNKTPVNILSLNTLGLSAFSGLHKDRQWETKTQCVERYRRIASGLSNAATKHSTAIIVLQEVSHKIMLPILTEKFSKQWTILQRNSLFTLHFNDSGLALKNANYNNKKRTLSTTYNDIKTKQTLTIHNVWSIYNPIPCDTEAYYFELLNQPGTQVVVGDTNSRVAPLHNKVENIITGIIPVHFNESAGIKDPEFQRVDYPDGAFQSNGNRIQQLERTVLDFATGEVIISPPPTDDDERSDYKMLLCLDSSYRTRAIIANYSLYGYQQQLRKSYNDEKMIVRMAANNYNQKAIAITFPGIKAIEYYAKLHQKYASDPRIVFSHVRNYSNGRYSACIYIPLNMIPMLNDDLTPPPTGNNGHLPLSTYNNHHLPLSTGTKLVFSASTLTSLGAASLGLWATLSGASLGSISLLGGLSVLSAIVWPLAIVTGVIAIGTGIYMLNKRGYFDGAKQKLFSTNLEYPEAADIHEKDSHYQK